MALTNSQMNTIMREYDDRRREAILDADRRLHLVYEKVDGYKELSDAIAALSIEHTKSVINKSTPDNSLSDLKQMIEDLKHQKQALLVNAGYSEDYCLPRYTCPDCKDTGYINNEKCHCLKRREIELLYDNSGINRQAMNLSFDDASSEYYSGEDLDNFLNSKEKAINFTKNFDNDYQNLLFYGTVGSGKSHLSSCIAGSLLNSGHSVIYFSATSLFENMSEGTFGKKKDILEDIYNCDLLIIDDLGTEMINSFVISSLFTLLNERLLRKKPIVISTNFGLEALRDNYSDRIFSRLVGNFKFCHMTGPDIRKL